MKQSSFVVNVDLLEQKVVETTAICGIVANVLHLDNAANKIQDIVKNDQKDLGLNDWCVCSPYRITDCKTVALTSDKEYAWFISSKTTDEVTYEVVVYRVKYSYE